MPQLPTPHRRTTSSQRDTRTSKQTPRPRTPPSRITTPPRPPPRRQFTSPIILTPRIRQRARQFRQTDTHAGRDEGKEDQAVDNLDGATAVDAGDEGGADAPPGICEGETDAEEGEPGVVSFEGGGVTHLGEGEGVGVEGGFGGGEVVGDGGGDVLFCHG